MNSIMITLRHTRYVRVHKTGKISRVGLDDGILLNIFCVASYSSFKAREDRLGLTGVGVLDQIGGTLGEDIHRHLRVSRGYKRLPGKSAP